MNIHPLSKPKIDKICKNCGKAFQVHQYRKETAECCSRSCATSYQMKINHPRKRPPEIRICLNCGKKYTINQHYDRNISFCSVLCSAKYSFSGSRQWKWKGGAHKFKCAVCGIETTKKRGASKNIPKYCSVKCSNIGKNTQIHTICAGCGKSFTHHPSKKKVFCSVTCYRHNRIKPNTIEKAVQDRLNSLDIAFIPEYPIARYHIDIFLKQYKIAIECDGDYWHRNLSEHEKKRDEFMRKAGICIIRLKETDIRKNLNGCIERILYAINHC